MLGPDHTNTLGVAQSLGREGIFVIIATWGVNKGLLKSCKYVKIIITGKNEYCCIDKIIDQFGGKSETKIIIIPCCDNAALAMFKRREDLKKFIFSTTNGFYDMPFLQRKQNQVYIAEKCGFNVPKSWIIDNRLIVPDDIIYPCILKPISSIEGCKADIRVCRDEIQLRRNLNDVLPHVPQLILQQFIEKDYDYVVLGLATSEKIIIPALIKKHDIYPPMTGLETMVTVNPIVQCDFFDTKPIFKYFEETKYEGLFSIEFVHSNTDGKFYYVETNHRNDGVCPAIVKAGVNLPYLHYLQLSGINNFTISEIEKPFTCIWESHHFLSLVHGKLKFSKWLSDIKNADSFLIYDKKDKKPIIKEITGLVTSKIKRFCRLKEYNLFE